MVRFLGENYKVARDTDQEDGALRSRASDHEGR